MTKNNRAGFTIVELLIVIAVSGVMALSAILMIGGQQAKSEFTQVVRDFDSRVQDIMNDYLTGYYPNTTNISCTAGSFGPPTITKAPKEQGANLGCAYIGKVLQMGLGDGSDYKIFSVAGRQFQPGSATAVTRDLIEAAPRVIYPITPAQNVPDASEDGRLGYGVQVGKMYYTDSSGASIESGAVGFFASFTAYGPASESPISAKQFTNITPIPGTRLGQTAEAVGQAIENIPDTATVGRPLTICLLSGRSDQHALLQIGDNARRVTTNFKVERGRACP